MTTTILPTGIRFPDDSVQLDISGLKSLQNLLVSPKGTVAGGDYNNNKAVNITISPVEPSKSFIIWPAAVPVADPNVGADFSTFTVKFLDRSTIQLNTYSSYNILYSVRIQIVEFW